MPMYMNDNRDEVKENALTCVNAFMERVGSVKAYLAGENLTYIDFYWYELLQAADWITNGEVMQQNEGLSDYCQRIEALNGIGEYKKSSNTVLE